MFKKKNRSIFRAISNYLIAVLIIEMILLTGCFFISGIDARLKRNAVDILNKQIENRKNYIENVMVESWSNLSLLAERINEETQEMLDSGELKWEDLSGDSNATTPLLMNVIDELIDNMYNKQLNGTFVIFNTEDLDLESSYTDKSGIYLRDMDPVSAPSYKKSDILLVRAPVDLVKKVDISTNNNWKTKFSAQEWSESGFMYMPFQTAYKHTEELDISEYGYWNPHVYKLEGDDRTAVSYSIPLMLDDGRVYGVLGVEILTDYLKSFIPYKELNMGLKSCYVIGVADENSGNNYIESLIVSSGTNMSLLENPISLIEDGNDGYIIDGYDDSYYVSVSDFKLYSNNGTFSDTTWKLLCIVPKDKLYSDSFHVKRTFFITSFITFIVGGICSMLVSRKMSKSVEMLSHEVAQNNGKEIPKFSKTGVKELDQFTSAISELSHEVLDTSTKFLKIIKMASIDIGGYEFRNDSDTVYVTDNFLDILEIKDIDTESINKKQFLEIVDKFKNKIYVKTDDRNIIYKINTSDGRVKYVRLEYVKEPDREVGIVEDITESVQEKLRIELERDSDALTGLYSRRAFYREVEEIFETPEKLGCAAFLMMDMDNLKNVNDTFGHNWGDQYIYTAASCFIKNVPNNTICARVSGDEFYIFLYGYENKDHIRRDIKKLTTALGESRLHLPSGKDLYISLSGGIAWYPDNSTDFNKLIKYADFAMYQAKCSEKGTTREFDITMYNQQKYELERKKEFYEMIEKEMLVYHFQPIVSVQTGSVFAYEALMRTDMPTLRSPKTILDIAKEEGCLHDIERITIFKSAQTFRDLKNNNLISKNAKLFVNSIANQCMTSEETERFKTQFKDMLSDMVIEITESENLDGDALVLKRNTEGFSGEFALDDYGSGYNSEANLLKLAPKYIKVDISIIKDIDSSHDKQQILSNMIDYAHQRNMIVLAECIETADELSTAVRLGVDLLQGYFLARPSAVPDEIKAEAIEIINNSRKDL